MRRAKAPLPHTLNGKRPGRYTKCTPFVITRLCEFLRAGNSRKTACCIVGIHETTFCRWMEQNDNFADAIQKAEEAAVAERVEAIRRAGMLHEVQRVKRIEGEDGSVIRQEVTTTQEMDWQANAWWLERRRPADYGKQAEAAMPVVNINVAIEPLLLKIYGNQAQQPAASPSDVIVGEIVEGADTEEE